MRQRSRAGGGAEHQHAEEGQASQESEAPWSMTMRTNGMAGTCGAIAIFRGSCSWREHVHQRWRTTSLGADASGVWRACFTRLGDDPFSVGAAATLVAE